MTRKSRRELERAVEDMGSSVSVDEWIGRLWVDGDIDIEPITVGADAEPIDDLDHEGEVNVWESVGSVPMSLWVPEAAVPGWVNVDKLPVIE